MGAGRLEQGSAVMESVGRAPLPVLRPLVAAYQGYRQEGLPPGTHRGLPSPYLTLIITLDDPLTVARHPDPLAAPGRYTTLAGGLHTTPAIISHDGRQSGIQLAVSPLGARALFKMPAGELAGTDVDAADVLGPAAAELHERLRQAPTWDTRFAILDQVLARLASLRPVAAAPEGVARAWQLILATGGTATAGQLADVAGWSPRHLRQQLRAETGLAPKTASRVVRFHRARRLLERRARAGQPLCLAGLAADCGYFDQAHFAREFRELAGSPPSAWLAAEFRNVQASAPGPEPDWGA
jgi:AraC-like DNA-binding protein